MKKALLVMDMQNVCLGEKHSIFFKYDSEKLIKAVNEVIEDNKDSVIVYIKNFMKRNFINKFVPFKAYEGTEAVNLVKNLKIVSGYVIAKYTGDAFTNPDLHKLLTDEKIDTVEIVGVDGGGCVSLTAMGAVKNGYKVIMNTKAIGTTFEKNRDKYFKKLDKLGVEFI